MEHAVRELSDDNSLAACIALGREPPVLGILRFCISSLAAEFND